MTEDPQSATSGEKVKALLGNAAKLAQKQAALTKITSVSLPKVYHAIGRRIASVGTLPRDLAPLRDKIAQLEASMAAQPEPPKADAAGFAAKAKHLAARASKTAVDAAAAVQVQTAYVMLGKQAAEKHGQALIPDELFEEYRSLVVQRDGLSAEIRTLVSAPGQGLITPKRLAIAGLIGCLLLGVAFARSASSWLFGGGEAESRYTSDRVKMESPEAGRGSDVVNGDPARAASRKEPDSASANQVANAPHPARLNSAEPSATARECVRLLVGETSNHYDEFGYNGVLLGQSFASVSNKRTLVNGGEYTGLTFHYEDESTGESFVFDDKDTLVSYGRHYQGGAKEYAPQLVELLGKATKNRIRTRDQTPANSSMRVEYTTIDYTFPKVLVRVVFEERTEQGQNAGQLTHVFVADRMWVEAILMRTAEDKLKVFRWLQAAAALARQGIFDPARIPEIPGTRVEVVPGQGQCLKFIDTKREAELKAKWGNDAEQLATCAGVEEALPGLQPVVYLDCFRCSATRLGARVKVLPLEGSMFPELAEPIQQTPILNDWLWRLNQIILEQGFPPDDDAVNLVRKPDLLGVQEWLEWTSTGQDRRRWKVLCGKNLAMRVEYLGQKKL